MYFSRGTTLIGSAAVLDSCSVSFLAVSSSLSPPPPPPLPGAARKKKPFPSTTSRIPYSRLLRRSFQLGAYSSSSRSLEQASFGRLRNGCLEKRCGHASASVGSTGEGRRGVIPRGDGFEKVQIDARVCKILLGAAVAARVVVAFASENLSNGSSSHELHENYAEGAHAAHHHTHEEHEHHHNHEQQCCHQHHHHRTEDLNQVQRLVQRVSEVTGIARVADAWRDNLAVCCASTVLLLLGAVVPFVIPKQQSASSLQSLLVIPALPLTGVPAVLDATIDVVGGRVNIHVLMAFAALASVFMGNALEGGLLLAMFSLSHLAEDYFTERAMGDVKALKENNPESALVLDEFDTANPPHLSSLPYKQRPLAEVTVGSYVLVKAGEVVPVDGEVWKGKATVNVEHLTGEATPIEKQVGDSIPGGARNLDGLMIVKATRTWKESTVARIMQLTEEAQASRPKLERWLDEFSERYSQAVVAASLSVAVFGPFLFKWPFLGSSGVRGSLYRALCLMVAASPCALAVAPLAYATAISACARKGILLKGGEVLDALAVCDTVAFDKTGTLTTGELICKAIEPLRGHGLQEPCCIPSCETEALAVATAMERGAIHPIARAVVDLSQGKELPAVEIDDFEAIPGEGLMANVSNLEAGDKALHKARLGSLEFITSSCTSSWESLKIKEAASASAYSRKLVRAALSVDRKVTLFHFEDQLRENAAAVVKSLKEQAGMRVLMLTGDHSTTAERVAKSLGIDEFKSGLKPEDKLNEVKHLSQQNEAGGLIMVGDGINDAPALAAATVGIVLAQNASATAVAVADVLLLQDAIDGVPFVIGKAHQTTSLVKQSVALALSCIFLAGLPSVMGFLPLWLTVLLHEGGTLLVCINSVRALKDPSRSPRHRNIWLKNATSAVTAFLQRNTSTQVQSAPVVSS